MKTKKKATPKNPGLTNAQVAAEKRRIRAIAPSEAWVDASFTTIHDTAPDGEPIRSIVKSGAFPPKGMVECPICHRLVPPIDIETFPVKWQGDTYDVSGCSDHREQLDLIGYGPSASAMAIIALRNRKLRIDSTKLRPEKASKLRREIRRWQQTGQLPK